MVREFRRKRERVAFAEVHESVSADHPFEEHFLDPKDPCLDQMAEQDGPVELDHVVEGLY